MTDIILPNVFSFLPNELIEIIIKNVVIIGIEQTICLTSVDTKTLINLYVNSRFHKIIQNI